MAIDKSLNRLYLKQSRNTILFVLFLLTYTHFLLQQTFMKVFSLQNANLSWPLLTKYAIEHKILKHILTTWRASNQMTTGKPNYLAFRVCTYDAFRQIFRERVFLVNYFLLAKPILRIAKQFRIKLLFLREQFKLVLFGVFVNNLFVPTECNCNLFVIYE